jgi:aspartate kinase
VIVQKYGGTSVGSVERIREVAARIAEARARHDGVVVVVSAMAHTTDELLELAKQITAEPSRRELDMLLTAGERISMALVSMALNATGVPAISFTGSQSGIITDAAHTRAKIVDMRSVRIAEELARGKVVIVAGFQGVSAEKEITTLGRGGSDTSAVALAVHLKAEKCEIFTDVDGVYTADPRIVPEAKLLPVISYDEMVQLAASGSKVLHPRSVDLARTYKIPLWVRSSFTWQRGTLVTHGDKMEQVVVTGVTSETEIAKVAIKSVPNRPGIAAKIFRSLADRNVNIKFIIQSVGGKSGYKDITVLVPRDNLRDAVTVLEDVAKEYEAAGVIGESDIGRVSIVGGGMATTPGTAAVMFEALATAGINIDLINTSEIRIDCIIEREQVPEAVRVLHQAFALDQLERREVAPA